MIKSLPWQKVPQGLLLMCLPQMRWHKYDDSGSPAADAAALMLFVALVFMHDEEEHEGRKSHAAQASYEELGHATGLSRSLIRQGLVRLTANHLISPQGSNQRRRYELAWSEGSWIKLPCRAILSKDKKIEPFYNFVLRSKHDLHAMKLYLYLACVRSGLNLYSQARYETIWEKIGIPERDTRRAISMLLSAGLLKNVAREPNDGSAYGPNRYYLAGYEDLTNRSTLREVPGVLVDFDG